jgi:mannose-6-phosphate isomerase
MRCFLFEPIYCERVWGGTGLATHLGRALPAGKVIGESWEIVDRPEAQSRTPQGRSLRELIAANPEYIMGPGWPAAKPFPILVKWLDCQERLSLQVHPPASIAPSLGGEPKTENWFIARAEPHATLMAGLKRGVTADDFKRGLEQGTLEALIHTLPVRTGESIFIPSGRIHAIGAGNLILEIQQNSDTTYRVYDWGRVGLDGRPRELHVKESLASTDFADFEPATLPPSAGHQLLAESDVFRLQKFALASGASLPLPAGSPRILSVVSGELQETDGSVLATSANALLPAGESFAFTATRPSVVLVTDRFA